MADLPEVDEFTAGITQIDITEAVVGGPDGVSNRALKQLANRTRHLKNVVDNLPATVANRLRELAPAWDVAASISTPAVTYLSAGDEVNCAITKTGEVLELIRSDLAAGPSVYCATPSIPALAEDRFLRKDIVYTAGAVDNNQYLTVFKPAALTPAGLLAMFGGSPSDLAAVAIEMDQTGSLTITIQDAFASPLRQAQVALEGYSPNSTFYIGIAGPAASRTVTVYNAAGTSLLALDSIDTTAVAELNVAGVVLNTGGATDADIGMKHDFAAAALPAPLAGIGSAMTVGAPVVTYPESSAGRLYRATTGGVINGQTINAEDLVMVSPTGDDVEIFSSRASAIKNDSSVSGATVQEALDAIQAVLDTKTTSKYQPRIINVPWNADGATAGQALADAYAEAVEIDGVVALVLQTDDGSLPYTLPAGHYDFAANEIQLISDRAAKLAGWTDPGMAIPPGPDYGQASSSPRIECGNGVTITWYYVEGVIVVSNKTDAVPLMSLQMPNSQDEAGMNALLLGPGAGLSAETDNPLIDFSSVEGGGPTGYFTFYMHPGAAIGANSSSYTLFVSTAPPVGLVINWQGSLGIPYAAYFSNAVTWNLNFTGRELSPADSDTLRLLMTASHVSVGGFSEGDYPVQGSEGLTIRTIHGTIAAAALDATVGSSFVSETVGYNAIDAGGSLLSVQRIEYEYLAWIYDDPNTIMRSGRFVAVVKRLGGAEEVLSASEVDVVETAAQARIPAPTINASGSLVIGGDADDTDLLRYTVAVKRMIHLPYEA